MLGILGIIVIVIAGILIILYKPPTDHLAETRKKFASQLDKLWRIQQDAFRTKKYARAEKALLMILRVDERNAIAYNRLGMLFAKQRDFDDAIECFEIAQSLAPSASSFHNVGLIHMEVGDLEKAALAMEKAMELEEDSAFRHISYAQILEKLGNKKGREQLREAIYVKHANWDNMALSVGWDRIIISSVSLPEHQSFCGRSMEAIVRDPAPGAAGFIDPVDLLAELVSSEQGRVCIIILSMDPKDIDTIAALPWTCLISDSLYITSGNPHPRLNGAFPKFLREYVRERRMLSMREAIKKMTSMPAQRMGIKNRGTLCKGYAADILVFDPDRFTDNANYSNPTALATGMDTIILNGKIVYNNGKFHNPNGKVITRK